jgi:Do/DeqQ family serine protease
VLPVKFEKIQRNRQQIRHPYNLKNMNNLRKNAGIFILALAGSLSGMGLYNHFFQAGQSAPIGMKPVSARIVNFSGAAAPLDFTEAAAATVPAVVHVKTSSPNTNAQYMDPFSFFWGQPAPRQLPPQQSSGSGVIISADGYIVTNNHVVENASEINVTLDDKRTYTAKLIGTDPSTDLAVLKVEGKDLPYLAYGNSDEVKVGEWVMAVGNPFNLTSTVTAGIVSAKARNINILPNQKFPIESFIQTDAAVNPGNSGGALVNTSGDLVGINAAIASTTGSYSGYSFAIPVNIVRKVVDDLLEFGNVQRGFIGVSIRDIDSDFASQKDLGSLDGVYVSGLTEGGAAAIAGIKEGDIITKINGVHIRSTPELQEMVGRHRPGDALEVTVMRDKSEKTMSVVLRNSEGTTKVMRTEVVNVLGASLESVDSDDMIKLKIKSGVRVKDLQTGKLKSAGIKEGFIITSIDNQQVKNKADVTDYLKDKKGGVLIEGVYPNGMKAYYGFGL